MTDISIESEAMHDFDKAGDILANGMRDNPMHITVFGDDPAHRVICLYKLFSTLLALRNQPVIYARQDRQIVGVVALSAPGTCQPSFVDIPRILYSVVSTGVSKFPRFMKWISAWSKADPNEKHWHLGPVAVEPTMQGCGIGSILMKAFIEKMNTLQAYSYLETEKEINVAFYQRFGFEVIGEEDILGVHNWYMHRNPSS